MRSLHRPDPPALARQWRMHRRKGHAMQQAACAPLQTTCTHARCMPTYELPQTLGCAGSSVIIIITINIDIIAIFILIIAVIITIFSFLNHYHHHYYYY
jgi:hypothetical protein